MIYQLGRNPSPEDPRTLKLSNYVDLKKLESPPPNVDWRRVVKVWGAMLNDKIGCCTISAPGHQIQAWTANELGTQQDVPDEEILKAYVAVSGYNPNTGRGDRGANMMDVLKYWRSTGIGGHNGIGYVAVDPKNLSMVKAACWLFGGLYGGCQIPASWMTDNWISTAGPYAGGHAWYLAGVSASGDMSVITWGESRVFSLAAWRKTMAAQPMAELYAILGPEWTSGDGIAPSGFHKHKLANDLAEIAGEPKPYPDPAPQPPPTPPPPPLPVPTPFSVVVDAEIAIQGSKHRIRIDPVK
jgi:hypothetical protein